MKVRRIDFSPDEFLVGTRGLSNAEVGMYWRACSLIYSHGGPVDIAELRRWAPHGKWFDQVLARLVETGKLTSDGHQIGNQRCITELSRAYQRGITAVSNGSLGGRPRKNIKHVENPEVSSRANHQPSTITNTPHKPPRGLASEFAEWWLAYPHKVGKGAAEKAFATARKRVELPELLTGVQRYLTIKPDDHKWCNPATWLNQRRWEDQPDLPLANGHDPTGPPPAPIDPRKLNHFDGCTCRNCAQWAAQQGREAQHA